MYNPVKDSNFQVKIVETAEQTVSALSSLLVSVLYRTAQQDNCSGEKCQTHSPG